MRTSGFENQQRFRVRDFEFGVWDIGFMVEGLRNTGFSILHKLSLVLKVWACLGSAGVGSRVWGLRVFKIRGVGYGVHCKFRSLCLGFRV